MSSWDVLSWASDINGVLTILLSLGVAMVSLVVAVRLQRLGRGKAGWLLALSCSAAAALQLLMVLLDLLLRRWFGSEALRWLSYAENLAATALLLVLGLGLALLTPTPRSDHG